MLSELKEFELQEFKIKSAIIECTKDFPNVFASAQSKLDKFPSVLAKIEDDSCEDYVELASSLLEDILNAKTIFKSLQNVMPLNLFHRVVEYDEAAEILGLARLRPMFVDKYNLKLYRKHIAHLEAEEILLLEHCRKLEEDVSGPKALEEETSENDELNEYTLGQDGFDNLCGLCSQWKNFNELKGNVRPSRGDSSGQKLDMAQICYSAVSMTPFFQVNLVPNSSLLPKEDLTLKEDASTADCAGQVFARDFGTSNMDSKSTAGDLGIKDDSVENKLFPTECTEKPTDNELSSTECCEGARRPHEVTSNEYKFIDSVGCSSQTSDNKEFAAFSSLSGCGLPVPSVIQSLKKVRAEKKKVLRWIERATEEVNNWEVEDALFLNFDDYFMGVIQMADDLVEVAFKCKESIYASFQLCYFLRDLKAHCSELPIVKDYQLKAVNNFASHFHDVVKKLEVNFDDYNFL